LIIGCREIALDLASMLALNGLINAGANDDWTLKKDGVIHSRIELSRPVAVAALAIPDRFTAILSAYCNGIRADFHPPA
jgi:hypothetical protein